MSLSLRVDKPKMESDNSNMIRVKIIKKIDTGLGFLIQPRSEKPHVVISAIVSGGMAEKCGLIRIGDVIVRVNEMDLSDMVYEKCVDLLKSLPQETAVSLLLKGPDGYTSYLHTTFLENGTPHTTRITKPVANNESFVSRLRRTFGRSQSPSGRTPLRQSRSGNISPKRNKQKQEKEKIDTDQMDQTCFVCPVNHSSTSKVQNDAESQTDGENAKQVIPSVTANGGPLVIIRESKKTVNNNSLKNINNSEINNKVDTIDNNTVKNHSTDSQLNVIPNGRVNGAENLEERRDSKGIIVSPSMQRKEGMAHNSPAQQKRYVKLRNIADSKLVFTDTLHSKAIENVPCAHNRCLGSLMGTSVPGRAQGTVRPKEEMLVHAKDFFDQYFTSIKRQNTPAHQTRLSEVYSSIEKTGKYELTTSELTYGAKLAWRNAARCIGRIQWSKLQVFDARHITTARGMFEAICNHIKYATNKGNIRSAITVFPPRTDSKHDFRVWNTQLIMYAGYKQPDGSVIGDPASIDFTNVVIKMGWKPKFGMFDVLPLILQANGMDPEMFEIPAELIFEVPIKHPKFPSFAELGLKWFALPAVSAMLFDCGGLEFTACPFNGWYMGTEIASRDFLDAQRYNLIEKIAEKLGLDTRKNSSLWRDRVCVETNIAVLHSYQVAGATIMDHHAASESFMKFMENEMKQRGGCPADWVWVVPPLSSSITPVFHQEMLLYKLKPSYEYQDEVFRTYVWKKDREKGKTVEKRRRKFGFKELARAVKFSAKLMVKALSNRVKCTILYATETGKSERFAKTLCEIFKHAFDAKVVDMAEYDAIHLEHEALVLFITSTFGNGDPPENGEAFAKNLHDLNDVKSTKNGEGLSTQYFRMSTKSESEDNQQVEDKILEEVGPLSNVRFSVFGLGSRAYPNFCAFAHYIDNMMNALGSERIYKMGEGDELCGQEETFRQWAKLVFKAACDTFCVGDENSIQEATGALSKTDFTWSPEKFRLTPSTNETPLSLCEALSKMHSKNVLSCSLSNRIQLQDPKSERQTYLANIDLEGNSADMNYSPGDHVAIFPLNSSELVDGIITRLHNAPPPDQLVKLEVIQELTTPMGTQKSWKQFEKIPTATMKTMFSRFLDITTPPSQELLKQLVSQATRDNDKIKIENLANDIHEYEDWRYEKMPNVLEVLEEFPSLKINPSLLISQLPLLQQRFYSISSSQKSSPGEVHATIGVLKYNTMDGAGALHYGVCSSWLNTCDIGEEIPCAMRMAPLFHLPDDATLPIIMVGPGTGIAPFRSFWHQRKIDKNMLPVPKHGDKIGWGEMYLYFGCRKSAVDYIYKEELDSCLQDDVLTKVYTAFSREPGQPKTYVQDMIKKNGQEVFDAVFKNGGHFYVCGDVQMASDVTETLCKIIQEKGKMSKEQAQSYMLKLKEANRFHEDIFGVSAKQEFTDKVRDQAKRAWKYINATKPVNNNKEVAVPIPPPVSFLFASDCSSTVYLDLCPFVHQTII
ncbi:nitric-oxide synthase, brain [Mytilus galloprovincialis]|uniref:Nitric oxide synthase 1 n=1 Tax=Mytilus galloprovincialis TaxID=29158 RepID=A0A8B6G6Q4_MYTGA|nr:nitric-oxide synthase, brain [Mytilus galloprovincialis]